MTNKKLHQELIQKEKLASEIHSEKLTPFEYFCKFVDVDVMNLIKNESISYARFNRNNSYDLDTDDLFVFLGVLIVSSYSKVSRKRMYWELNDE